MAMIEAAQAAQQAGVSRESMIRAVSTKKVKGKKQFGRWLVDTDSLASWIETLEKAAAAS